MGLGFTIGLSFLGAFRELLGNGTIANFRLIPQDFSITIFILAPGAFFVLAFLVAVQNKVRVRAGKKPKEAACIGDCMSCAGCNDKELQALVQSRKGEE